MDEGAADAAVPVRERVDGLELRVGDRGLDDGREVRPVHERDQVVHEALHVLGRGRDEVGAAGVVGVPANPVLALAELAGDLRRGRREHEVAVDLEDVLEPERLRAGAEGDGVLHGDDVAEDGPGGLVAGVGLLGLRARQAALGEDEPLDPGGGDRLGAEQAPGEDLEAGQARRVAVQGVDGALGDGDRGGDVRRQGELEVRDRVGDEGAVAERAALGPAAGRGGIGGPGAGLVPSHGKRTLTSASGWSRFNAKP